MLAWAGLAATVSPAVAASADLVNPPPAATDWTALAALPDWSGVWNPDITDQNAENVRNPPSWNPAAAAKIAALQAREQAGDPKGLFVNCLPEGMPSWMLISHNALEFVFSPGRVTLLGESDSNRLRRVYTDGRGHPDDPDLTFHGHSIGHWEGEVLVVDTVGVLPETYLALGEAVGVPNNGDLHVVERIHLKGPDTLVDELTIDAPHVLAKPWTTSRIYYRQRARKFDIVEGVCLQGSFLEDKDKAGDAVFTPTPQTDQGNPALPAQ